MLQILKIQNFTKCLSLQKFKKKFYKSVNFSNVKFQNFAKCLCFQKDSKKFIIVKNCQVLNL